MRLQTVERARHPTTRVLRMRGREKTVGGDGRETGGTEKGEWEGERRKGLADRQTWTGRGGGRRRKERERD